MKRNEFTDKCFMSYFSYIKDFQRFLTPNCFLRAKWDCSRELLSIVIWETKTTRYLVFYWLIMYVLLMEQKKILFDHLIDIRDEPVRPGLNWPNPARSTRNARWRVISQSVCQLKVLTNFRYRFYNNRINFWTENLHWFWNNSVSWKAIFYAFLGKTQEPLNISKILLFHMEERPNIFKNHVKVLHKKKFL